MSRQNRQLLVYERELPGPIEVGQDYPVPRCPTHTTRCWAVGNPTDGYRLFASAPDGDELKTQLFCLVSSEVPWEAQWPAYVLNTWIDDQGKAWHLVNATKVEE